MASIEIEQYCAEHNLTEPQLVDGRWFAFPPGGVMPVEIPWQSSELAAPSRWHRELQDQIDELERDIDAKQGMIRRLEASEQRWLKAIQQCPPKRPPQIQLEELRSICGKDGEINRQASEALPGPFDLD